MLLAREFVSYLSKQLVKRLTAGVIETSAPDAVAEKIAVVITGELAVEDKLNDEVRDLLSQYACLLYTSRLSLAYYYARISSIRLHSFESITSMSRTRPQTSPANPFRLVLF